VKIPEDVLFLIQQEQEKSRYTFIPMGEQYLQKIYEYADLITYFKKGECLGYVFFYSNDIQKNATYITLVGVSEKFKGQGVGKNLIRAVIEISRSNGFKFCDLEVSRVNVIALRLYYSLGFREIKDNGDKLLMRLDLM